MEKKRDLFLAQVAGAAIVAFSLGFFIAWLFFNYPPKDSGHIAAWVQAVGSIGAIGVAIYVLQRQSKNQQELQRQEWERKADDQKNNLKGIVIFLGTASNSLLNLCDELPERTKNPDFLQKSINDAIFNGWEEVLRKVELSRPDIAEITPQVINLILQVQSLNSISCEQAVISEDDKKAYVAVIKTYIQSSLSEFKLFSEKYCLNIKEEDLLVIPKTIEIKMP